ncbi:sulfotransferase 1A2 [Patella vulgata]|uniref:sulfotransferase 1A2 n=1 Tax=Patella vulgata TaxID=6465 RepID=UPI0024A91A75|nr:sulfotransferase 1A2 [Patella vulgata]
MSVVEITDGAGKHLRFVEFDGKLYPKFSIDVITNMKSLKLRKDDIIISAYPKSGTHWLFEICRMLLAGRTDLQAISKSEFFIEKVGQDVLDQAKSPRILNSHVAFSDLPTDLAVKKPKIIYIRRNPKDLAVSFYNHCYKIPLFDYKGEFKDFIELFINGTVEYNCWYKQVLDWEKVIDNNTEYSILHLTYEDLKADPIAEIRKISDFLQVKKNEELIQGICDACSFAKMQTRMSHVFPDENGKSKIYRKGEVGDWKNWFTVAQSEWFDRVYRERMSGSKLKFRYSLDEDAK